MWTAFSVSAAIRIGWEESLWLRYTFLHSLVVCLLLSDPSYQLQICTPHVACIHDDGEGADGGDSGSSRSSNSSNDDYFLLVVRKRPLAAS